MKHFSFKILLHFGEEKTILPIHFKAHEGIMANNNTVTKDDLQNAINKAIAELTNVIKVVVDERVSSTETNLTSTATKLTSTVTNLTSTVTKLTAEMDKRFQSADRQRRAFREEVGNRFHEIRGMIMNRFDEAKEYTDAAVVEKIRELKVLLDDRRAWLLAPIPNNKL